MASRKGSHVVCSWGINDVDYNVIEYESWYDESGKYVRKVKNFCPFYIKWRSMVERCHSKKLHEKRPTYKDCSICEEWRYFSNFKAWMETKDWQGKALDKDIINQGNKVYSPETCLFVSAKVNGFVIERNNAKGDYPIGVYRSSKRKNKFTAKISNYRTNKSLYLGDFYTWEEAHASWLAKKLEYAKEIAASLDDPEVAKFLVLRYTNYDYRLN